MLYRVGPLGMLPLPPNPFDGTESQLDPDPQTVPTYTDALRWQVGQQNPGLDLTMVPNHHQNPTAAQRGLPEGRAGAYPPVAWSRHQCAGGHTAASVRLERGIVPDPHKRMPTQGAYLFPETGAPRSTLGQHQYGRPLGDHRLQKGEQVHSGRYPRAGPVAGQDMPCHRDGAGARWRPLRSGGLGG